MSAYILSLYMLSSFHLSFLLCPCSVVGAHIEVRAEGLTNECKKGKEEFDKAMTLLNFAKKEMENQLFATMHNITSGKNVTEQTWTDVDKIQKYLESLKYITNKRVQLNETLEKTCVPLTKEVIHEGSRQVGDESPRGTRMRFPRAVLPDGRKVELKRRSTNGLDTKDEVLIKPIKPRLFEDCDVCESIVEYFAERLDPLPGVPDFRRK